MWTLVRDPLSHLLSGYGWLLQLGLQVDASANGGQHAAVASFGQQLFAGDLAGFHGNSDIDHGKRSHALTSHPLHHAAYR